MSNPDRLTAIKARVEEATPGPWTSGRPIPGKPMFVVCECAGWFVYPATNEVTHGTAASDDADFIAHAREDLPWALDEIERMWKALDIATERACIFDCDAESSCECRAHALRRAALSGGA